MKTDIEVNENLFFLSDEKKSVRWHYEGQLGPKFETYGPCDRMH